MRTKRRYLGSKLMTKFGSAVVVLGLASSPPLLGQKDIQAPLIPAASRKAAPAFQLVASDGTTAHLSDYRGKVVLLNFWATDCGGCVLEIPSIIKIENDHKAQAFVTVGVSMDISYERLSNATEAWAKVPTLGRAASTTRL